MILLALGYLTSVNSHYKNEWQLFRTPEKVAELYFADHTRLPTNYSPGEIASFAFSVSAATATDYRYEVVQEDAAGGATSILKSGSLTLPDNQSHTEKITIRYVDAGPRSKITVRLLDQNQSIHYWAERQ